MAPSGVEFVRAVMRQLGATNAAELAEAMRWKRGKERLVAKWLAGTNKPSYQNMMEMMDRSGWLSEEAGAPSEAVRPTPQPSPPDPLGEIAISVAGLVWGQARLLEHFGLPLPEEAPAQDTPALSEAPPTDQETVG